MKKSENKSDKGIFVKCGFHLNKALSLNKIFKLST